MSGRIILSRLSQVVFHLKFIHQLVKTVGIDSGPGVAEIMRADRDALRQTSESGFPRIRMSPRGRCLSGTVDPASLPAAAAP
jgi:hypothetical protein